MTTTIAMAREERWAAPLDPLASRYEVSDRGRVRHARTGRLLRAWPTGNYLRVTCYGPAGRKAHRRVHRLVYEAFEGPVLEAHDVDHVDGDPRNNALSNLQLLSRGEHNRKTYATGAPRLPRRALALPAVGVGLRAVPAGFFRARVLRGAVLGPLPRVEVSPCGRFVLRDGRPLRVYGAVCKRRGSSYHGYPQVAPLGSAHRMVALHVMVAWAFLGPPPSADAVVHHRDDDRSHAAAANLQWTSQFLNCCHGRASRGQSVCVLETAGPRTPLGFFPCKREALRALGYTGTSARAPAGFSLEPAPREVSVGRFADPALAARAAARRARHSSRALSTALGKRRRPRS